MLQDIGYKKDCNEFTETKCRTVFDTKVGIKFSVPTMISPPERGEVQRDLPEAVRHGL